MNDQFFHLPTAIHCAKAIESLYRGDLELNIINPSTDTQGRVEEIAAGRWAILFPGTASIHDWRTDAKIRKTAWAEDGARAHRGFVAAWRSVAAEILGLLPDHASVTLAGHSLGGALATLCADVLDDAGIEIEAVYTFGSPRVFNAAGAKTYNEELAEVTHRIVNAGDPIPHLPWVFGSYRHVDSLTYLTRAGSIETNFVFAAARELVTRNSELETPTSVLGPQTSELISARAHSLASYIEKLEALA
jgi:pimeloyl-ACP methyl ester carboxylesterase